MDELKFKVEKENIKILAEKSIFLSVSDEILSDFKKGIDMLEHNDSDIKILEELHKTLLEERSSINNEYKKILENKTSV